MNPVTFDQANSVRTAPQGMPECGDLPVFADGRMCISCWELTDEELEQIKATKRVYLGVVSGRTQPPVFLTVAPPFPKNQFLAYEVWYQRKGMDSGIWIYVLEDAPIPSEFKIDDQPFEFKPDNHNPRFRPQKQIMRGEYFFRKPTKEEQEERIKAYMEQWKEANPAGTMVDAERQVVEEAARELSVICYAQLVGNGVSVIL